MTVAKRRAVTLADVAAKAGVSRSTASRALNHSARISRETTKRIIKLAHEMGFVPNAQGRALAVGRTETIAILVTEPLDELFADPTYAVYISGVTEKLGESSYLPVLLQSSTEFERSRVLQHMERQAFDAVIDISPYADRTILEEMHTLAIPGVLLGQMENQLYEGVFSIVYSDDTQGARLAAQVMRDRGRRHPVVILGPKSNPATPDRLKGYRSVYGDSLSEDRVFFTGWDASAGFTAMRRLLERVDKVDGVLAGSDRIAAGVIEALQGLGISVPNDVSVVGFDDHPLAKTVNPPLTTVHQPLRSEGFMAADLAMKMIEGEEPVTKVMQMSITMRDSL